MIDDRPRAPRRLPSCAVGSMLLIAFFGAGCDRSVATQVIVLVDADEVVRARASQLELSVIGPDGETYRRTRADFTWPAVLPVAPLDGDAARRVTVLARALEGDSPFAEARARFGFVRGRRLEVRMLLESGCGLDCSPVETCFGGRCRSACVTPTPPESVPRSTPTECVEPDAGLADADAGIPLDADPCGCGPCMVCSGDGCTPTADGASCEGGTCVSGACCAGCVDGTVTCLPGTELTACGSGGRACSTCACGGDRCDRGACRPELPVDAVSGYSDHVCATSGARLYCWGRNDGDQLGTAAETGVGASTPQLAPFPVDSVDARGDHSCSIDGSAGQCWGDDTVGELRPDVTTDRRNPVDIDPSLGTSFQLVRVGCDFSCGLRTDGRIACWGGNDMGQLGIGAGPGSYLSGVVDGTFTRLALGEHHALAVDASGAAFAWGRNDYGQLGTGNRSGANAPVGLETPTNVVVVALGGRHGCAVDAGGTLWCWGANDFGQLGFGFADSPCAAVSDCSYPSPSEIGGPYDAVSVGAGHTCTISGGVLECFGDNSSAQIGDGGTGAPVLSPYRHRLHAIAVNAGRDFTCAIADGGALYCWGDNDFGRLGIGETTRVIAEPRRVCF